VVAIASITATRRKPSMTAAPSAKHTSIAAIVVVPGSSSRRPSSSVWAAMIIQPTTAKPTGTSHGASSSRARTAHSAPSSATSANVRRPALADGLRSRSSPMNSPIARLVRKPV
jgi:hypothetical protein